MIRLEKVNGNNVWDLLKLRVSEEQKNIVADNDISIIEAYTAITENGYAFPFGIYDGDTPLGFLMIGFDTDDYWDDAPAIAKGNYNLWRLMIDKAYQGKRYGMEDSAKRTTVKVNPQLLTRASLMDGFFIFQEGVDEMLNQEYLPCNRQIHIKLSDEELNLIRERMEQMAFSNMSAYIRKMAIDGYQIKADFSEIHELARLMSIDSRNINQIAKAANTYGWVDEKIIADMKAEHEKVLKTVKDKDEWSSLANFIGNIIAKYADEIDFDSLPDPDVYLQKRYI